MICREDVVDFQPLWNDGPVIASHAIAAFAAMGMGLVQFALPKGTAAHRITGYTWVGLMVFVAVGSFWIHEFRLIGPFSPIHLLSLLALYTVWAAIASARAGRIARHRQMMIQLYVLALILTGAFTLLPGRTMHAVLFGGGA